MDSSEFWPSGRCQRQAHGKPTYQLNRLNSNSIHCLCKPDSKLFIVRPSSDISAKPCWTFFQCLISDPAGSKQRNLTTTLLHSLLFKISLHWPLDTIMILYIYRIRHTGSGILPTVINIYSKFRIRIFLFSLRGIINQSIFSSHRAALPTAIGFFSHLPFC